ncbi:hypothetical protein [Brassicibacter mesophilus]|uniref:hypothetical protein n=1 Tax=Brassicibacter mesophilus TaxID=745119 RepID=UPI003D216A82
MYRILCESYKNYMKDFSLENCKDYRYKIMLPFKLLIDLDEYKEEKKNDTLNYRKLQDFIWLVKQNINEYPNFKALLWSLESRGIYGKSYGILTNEEFTEQTKIMNMFLKLCYWN